MLLSLFWTAYGVLILIGIVSNILVVGKERKPITAGTAAVTTLIGMVVFFAIIVTLTRLNG